MADKTRPTKKQKEMLVFIENFISGHGYGPSYREIQRGLGYKSVATVAGHVDNLIARGHLVKRSHSARSLELTATSKSVKLESDIKPEEEKWLVDVINTKFEEQEAKKKPASKQIDELYVLVGSLKVLGFEDAARSFIGRLTALNQKKTD